MKKTIAIYFAIVVLFKIVAAWRLDLFGDEAFYWQCGQRLAWAYADHPPMTALLVRGGSALLGDTPLGARALFILLGAAIPMAVFALARPLVGNRDAWLATGAALVVPGIALFGFIALPDVPMLLFGLLFMTSFERATRTSSERAWLAAGVFAGLGFLTHYRFVLFPFAALIFLLINRRARPNIRNLWLAAVPAALGLMPTLIDNLGSEFAPTRYYLGERHGFAFDLDAFFELLASQVALVTPLLFVFLIVTLVQLVRRARQGDDRAGLMVCFSLTFLTVFFAASPLEVSGLMTAHWPLPGYLGLLPYLPGTLRSFRSASTRRWRRLVVWITVAFGAIVLNIVLFDLATDTLRIGTLRRPFTGWTEAAEKARELSDAIERDEGGRVVIVADNYMLGASLEFQLHDDAEVFVLDHAKNRNHGRARQFDDWQTGEAGLRTRGAEEALVVVEWSQIVKGNHDAWMAHVGSFFQELEPLEDLRLTTAGKSKKYRYFRYYRGRGIPNP